MNPLVPIIGFTIILLIMTIGGLIVVLSQKRTLTAKLKESESEEVKKDSTNQTLTNKLSEITTKQHENQLAGQVLQTMNAGVIVLDKDGIIRLVNTYALDTLGLSKSDLQNQHYHTVLKLTADENADAYGPIKDALTGKQSSFAHWTYVRSAGKPKPISGAITPINTETSSSGAVVVFRDATLEHFSEEEEKTFLSTAAHELRSPLTSIQAALELLVDGFDNTPPEKIKETLISTTSYVNRMITLVNDFLNVSRIAQRRIEITIESFDIVTLTEQVIKQYDGQIKQKHLYITHEKNTPIRTVKGDENKTREVLTNLLSNAIKYTIRGGITISHQGKDGKITTTVTDTGVGISSRDQSLLFGKFQQIGQSRRASSGSSTGLGLYIAHELAQLMHGSLVLEKSEPNVGSSFAFTLPVATSSK